MPKRIHSPQSKLLGSVLAGFMLLGTGSRASANGHGEHESKTHVVPESSVFSTRGVDLGEFRIRANYPSEGQKSKVAFTLYAIVDKEHVADSAELFEHRKQKLRDQVIIATRLVPLIELDDAELKSFRKRILLRIRRAIPELSIDDVYVTDFTLAIESI